MHFRLEVKSNSTLQDFIDKTAAMGPLERGQEFMKSENIATAHENVAEEGQTAAPDRQESLVTHFVAFVNKDGHLYELDGRREFPINHGVTSNETLLKVILHAFYFASCNKTRKRLTGSK